jgi:hypothetical protein
MVAPCTEARGFWGNRDFEVSATIEHCIDHPGFPYLASMLSVFRCALRTGLLAVGLFAASVFAQNDAASRRAAIEGMYPVMLGALEAKNFGRARNICEQAIVWEPQNPVHHYNLACIEAQAGGPRIAYAWGALELAIALGFSDVNHLQTDPDLAPLRGDPKFANLVRKVAYAISVGDAAPASPSLSENIKPAPAKTIQDSIDAPTQASITEGVPVGLYLVSRYIPAQQMHELSVWYFAPDHQVYCDLEDGFSVAELAKHSGRRGTLQRSGESVEITWSDGQKSRSKIERDRAGFTWDMGIFVPVTAFETSSEVAGVYEGYEPVTAGSSGLPVVQRLELRGDGSFTWRGVTFKRSQSKAAKATIGSNEETTGQWELSGLSLILKRSDGLMVRRIAFPQDDESTVIRPDRIFLGGLMYKRRP